MINIAVSKITQKRTGASEFDPFVFDALVDFKADDDKQSLFALFGDNGDSSTIAFDRFESKQSSSPLLPFFSERCFCSIALRAPTANKSLKLVDASILS